VRASRSRPRLRRDDLAGRRERASQILVVAAELIERWGFDKTTIDDIARSAGVAKGTIYLHWKTREALLLALLRQERVLLLADVRRQLVEDAAAPIARTVFRYFAAAMLRRPLVRAVVLNDHSVLGRLAAEPREPGDISQRAGFADYLETLREHRAIRADLSIAAQVNIVSASFMGTLLTSPMMPGEYALDDDQRADLLAETIHRTLGTGRPLGARAEAALVRASLGYVDNALTIARQQLDEAFGLTAATEEGA
jgi:AcrR family transcriptional regulator